MSEEQYASHRYAIGVPEGPLDITPNEAFPLESNFDYLNGGELCCACPGQLAACLYKESAP
jgi:folate-binding Fe-S cluster repair protein YgfZ